MLLNYHIRICKFYGILWEFLWDTMEFCENFLWDSMGFCGNFLWDSMGFCGNSHRNPMGIEMPFPRQPCEKLREETNDGWYSKLQTAVLAENTSSKKSITGP